MLEQKNSWNVFFFSSEICVLNFTTFFRTFKSNVPVMFANAWITKKNVFNTLKKPGHFEIKFSQLNENIIANRS